jgi:hypothetical protein
MKYLYKYPADSFPYEKLVHENSKRSRAEKEYELLDTGVFDESNYFDVFVEYAKSDSDPEDILIRITAHNRSLDPTPRYLAVLPTLWFRNTWSWGVPDHFSACAAAAARARKPLLNDSTGRPPSTDDDNRRPKAIFAKHDQLGEYDLFCEEQCTIDGEKYKFSSTLCRPMF